MERILFEEKRFGELEHGCKRMESMGAEAVGVDEREGPLGKRRTESERGEPQSYPSAASGGRDKDTQVAWPGDDGNGVVSSRDIYDGEPDGRRRTGRGQNATPDDANGWFLDGEVPRDAETMETRDGKKAFAFQGGFPPGGTRQLAGVPEVLQEDWVGAADGSAMGIRMPGGRFGNFRWNEGAGEGGMVLREQRVEDVFGRPEDAERVGPFRHARECVGVVHGYRQYLGR